jgi:hypothetical protein
VLLVLLEGPPAVPPDALGIIFSFGGWAITALLGLVVTMLFRQLKGHEKTSETLDAKVEKHKSEREASDKAFVERIHQLELAAAGFNGFMGTAAAKIMALETTTLTARRFDDATAHQNEKLDMSFETLNELRSKFENLDKSVDKGLGARPTRSEMNLLAVKVIERKATERATVSSYPPPLEKAPIRRTDSVSDRPGTVAYVEPPPPLPAMRPKKPSHHRR